MTDRTKEPLRLVLTYDLANIWDVIYLANRTIYANASSDIMIT